VRSTFGRTRDRADPAICLEKSGLFDDDGWREACSISSQPRRCFRASQLARLDVVALTVIEARDYTPQPHGTTVWKGHLYALESSLKMEIHVVVHDDDVDEVVDVVMRGRPPRSLTDGRRHSDGRALAVYVVSAFRRTSKVPLNPDTTCVARLYCPDDLLPFNPWTAASDFAT